MCIVYAQNITVYSSRSATEALAVQTKLLACYTEQDNV